MVEEPSTNETKFEVQKNSMTNSYWKKKSAGSYRSVCDELRMWRFFDCERSFAKLIISYWSCSNLDAVIKYM